jgi:hypothetical protein
MDNISTFSYPSWSITPATNLMGGYERKYHEDI